MDDGWSDIATAAAAKSLQLCPTLCDPIDGSLPGSPVPGRSDIRYMYKLYEYFSLHVEC